MSKTVRDIDITLKINGETRHPVSISMTARINSYPVVQVLHHGDNEAYNGAVDVTSGDIAKEMGARQNTIFRERSTADAELKIADGQGGSISFKGFITSPNYSFSSRNVDLSDVILPEYAKMESLDFSCYQVAAQDIDVLDMEPSLEDEEKVPTLFYKCGQKLMEVWKENKDSYAEKQEDLQTRSQEEQDKINQKVISIFKDLMDASAEADDNGDIPFGWEDLAEWLSRGTSVIADEQVRTRMYALLKTASGSFFTTICKFAEEYQCLYVPEWDKVGKVMNRNRLYDNPVGYTIAPTSLTLSGGTKGLFPTRYVAVTPNVAIADIDDVLPPEKFVAFPASLTEGGTAMRNPGPPWLPSWLAEDNVNEKGKSPQDLSKGLLISYIERLIKSIEDDKKLYNRNINKILKAWAKSVYFWQSLGASSARFSIPLDLSMKPGYRYNIKNQLGEQLATGFLQEVSHAIVCSGQGADATTSLAFSHLELPGFELPGKNG